MQNQSHSLGIIPISLSKLLERFAFYGMRSILILYMVNQFAISRETTHLVYGIFVFMVGFLPIVGGLIGDFLLNTKTTAIIGSFTQAVGCFVMATPSSITIYFGLFLIAMGTGLYAPNLTSIICSLYRNRIERFDSALLITYVCINTAAGLGAVTIALASDGLGYQAAFILCGIIMAGSSLVLLLSKNLLKEAPQKANVYIEEQKNETAIGLRIVIIIIVFLTTSVFWAVTELSTFPIYNRILDIEAFSQAFLYYNNYINPITVIIVGTLLAIIYSFFKSSPLLKIAIGYLIFLLSIVIIGIVYQTAISTSFMLLVVCAFFLQAVAELFISPSVFSIICRYGSAKYNATLIGAYSAFTGMVSFAASYGLRYIQNLGSMAAVVVSLCIIIFFAATFFVLYFFTKQNKTAV